MIYWLADIEEMRWQQNYSYNGVWEREEKEEEGEEAGAESIHICTRSHSRMISFTPSHQPLSSSHTYGTDGDNDSSSKNDDYSSENNNNDVDSINVNEDNNSE